MAAGRLARNLHSAPGPDSNALCSRKTSRDDGEMLGGRRKLLTLESSDDYTVHVARARVEVAFTDPGQPDYPGAPLALRFDGSTLPMDKRPRVRHHSTSGRCVPE